MALLDIGSFSRAADALGVSQPTLSRSIKELEARVGLPLFSRDRSGIEPTDFGRVFLQHAAHVLAEVGDLEREVSLAKGLGTGELSAGLGPYVLDVLGSGCAARFAAAHPGVRLRILMNDPALVARLLRARTVDLAVAEASVLEGDDAFEIITKLAPLAAYVVVRAGHPLAGKANIEIADVLDYPFAQVVMLPPRLLKPILAARRAPSSRSTMPSPPFPAIECPTLQMAARIVANSNAFTFATLGMVRAELELRQVVPVLQASWMRTDWNIVRLRKRTMSPAMIAFVAELERTHADVLREEEVLCKRRYLCPDAAPEPSRKAQRHVGLKTGRAARERRQGKRDGKRRF